jgi:N-acetylglucosaminyldiphosphoundecaprenol N-acetyl-beta-D-mannosaminyltransferase
LASCFGVRIDGFAGLLARVDELVEEGGRHTIAYANAAVLNAAHGDEALRGFLNGADVCYCDGNGVRFAARVLGDVPPERRTGADWIRDFATHAEGRWRLFWLGGAPGVAAEAARRLRAHHPRLEIATEHGFHDDDVVPTVNAFRPHVVLVGMGTPLQERWVQAQRDRIQAPVVWCVGGLQDYVAGRVRRPGPRWLLDHHEWISRLAADPRRLWRRYVVGNTLFVGRVMAERFRGD